MSPSLKVLVTGGFGYLGKPIVDRLQSDGHVVTILSRDRRKRLRGTEWIRCDLANGADAERKIGGLEFDLVVHAAASQKSEEIESCNIDGTRNLWDSLSTKPARALFLSTIHVYGKPEGDVTEESITCPVTPYGWSKREGELITLDVARNACVLRLSNAYGCPDSLLGPEWNLFSNDLVRSAFDNGALRLRSDPRATRDFIWIHDIVEVVSRIANAKTPVGGVFNCTSGQNRTLRSVADLVRSIGEKKMKRVISCHAESIDSDSSPVYRFSSKKLESIVPLRIRDRLSLEISRTFDFLMETPHD